MTITIDRERPDQPDATSLILELDNYLKPMYPAENSFGYSVDKLIAQGVEFFVIRHEGKAAGCVGIQFYNEDDPPFGEIKRMYVRDAFRGLGLAKRLLQHIEETASAHGVDLIRLETGIYQVEAIGLYERYGYVKTNPFGDYAESPLNLFYEKSIAQRIHAA